MKRFAELESLRLRGAASANGRGYLVTDIEQLRSFGSASGSVSVFVLTQYISGFAATPLYTHTSRLWLLLHVLLLWISRLWLLRLAASDEDPVVYAITNKRNLALAAL